MALCNQKTAAGAAVASSPCTNVAPPAHPPLRDNRGRTAGPSPLPRLYLDATQLNSACQQASEALQQQSRAANAGIHHQLQHCEARMHDTVALYERSLSAQ